MEDIRIERDITGACDIDVARAASLVNQAYGDFAERAPAPVKRDRIGDAAKGDARLQADGAR